MSEYTDELISSLSEDFTKDIDLFLTNSNLDSNQKMFLIALINDAYRQGYQDILNYSEAAREQVKNDSEQFMKEFKDRLTGVSGIEGKQGPRGWTDKGYGGEES